MKEMHAPFYPLLDLVPENAQDKREEKREREG